MLIVVTLTKRYGKLVALRELDLEVRPGEVVALLGANGAGKTTCFKLLLGLVRPSAGWIEIDGLPAGHFGLRSRIGYCPEEPKLHEFLTVDEILYYYAELGRVPRNRRVAEVYRVCQLTGIDEIRNRTAGKLSKGQAQRVSLALSLLDDPPILLLDEPTSGLDPIGRIAVRELIERCRGEGKTILLNSHMLSEVERSCNRAVILRQGKKMWEGRLDNLTAGAGKLKVRAQGVNDATHLAIARLGLSLRSNEDGWEISPCPRSCVHDVAMALVSTGARVEALVPAHDALESLFLELNPPPAEEVAARVLHDTFESMSRDLNGGKSHVADCPNDAA